MQVVMPLDVGLQIEADDKVRTLVEVTERLDYYDSEEGQAAFEEWLKQREDTEDA